MAKKQKTLAKLKKELDVVHHRFIRQRDSEDGFFTCISSGRRLPVSQMHAGHFYASTFTRTRWDDRNVNGQSAGDNVFKHGNLLNYRRGMLARYGQGTLDELEALHNQEFKPDRQWLEERIKYYKDKLNNSI